jgi:hypothetical protein
MRINGSSHIAVESERTWLFVQKNFSFLLFNLYFTICPAGHSVNLRVKIRGKCRTFVQRKIFLRVYRVSPKSWYERSDDDCIDREISGKKESDIFSFDASFFRKSEFAIS